MTGDARSVRTTLILGGLGGLAYLLAGGFQVEHRFWPWPAFAIPASLIALYAALLARWSGRGFPAVLFPLLVLVCVGAAGSDSGTVWVPVLAILSWIRSGICFPRPMGTALWREAVLCGGGGLALTLWAPSTPLAWALGAWWFSLVQSLFFVVFEAAVPPETAPPDHFEAARRRIEALLDASK